MFIQNNKLLALCSDGAVILLINKDKNLGFLIKRINFHY